MAFFVGTGRNRKPFTLGAEVKRWFVRVFANGFHREFCFTGTEEECLTFVTELFYWDEWTISPF